MNIEIIPISELKSASYNPRKWDEKSLNDIKESIKKFGLVDPIIVNSAPARKNIIIGGHLRCRVAKELNIKEVPVVYVNIPEIEREKELNLRLNRNIGEWDYELLKDFDMDLLMDIGFDNEELNMIFTDLLELNEDEFNIEKAVSEIDKSRIKHGEVYQLGTNKLMCGDSTKEDDVKKLMDDEKADIIYCDPPYNIGLSYSGGMSESYSQVRKRKKQIKTLDYGGKYSKKDDYKTRENYKLFLDSTIKNALKFSKEDLHIFYWCDENYIGLLQELYKENTISPRRVCIWVKNNFNLTPQFAFNKIFESCIYGTIGKPYLNKNYTKLCEILNKEIETGNQISDEILDIINIWLAKRDFYYEHPTQKPLTLHEKPLRRCTKPNDLILDLFGGSGSTLIAAEQLKRRAYLMEIDPIFCEVILRRYEKLTGKTARNMV